MILVTGATGHLGKAAIDALLKEGVAPSKIAALVRDPNKAADLKAKGLEIRVGNYEDVPSLQAATKGIDKILLISSSDVQNDRFQQHKNLIDAAIGNNVTRIAYTGIDIQSYEHTAIPHVSNIHGVTGAYLREKNLAYTILGNTLYADLILAFAGEQVLEQGLYFPAGHGKIPFLARNEMAAIAAKVIATEGHEGKEYAVTADVAYSFDEIAALISAVSGKEVVYHAPTAEEYIAKLNIPVAAFFAGFGTAIANGEFDTKRSDFEKVMGRKPQSLKDFLAGIYK